MRVYFCLFSSDLIKYIRGTSDDRSSFNWIELVLIQYVIDLFEYTVCVFTRRERNCSQFVWMKYKDAKCILPFPLPNYESSKFFESNRSEFCQTKLIWFKIISKLISARETPPTLACIYTDSGLYIISKIKHLSHQSKSVIATNGKQKASYEQIRLYIKTQFRKIGVQNFPRLTKNLNTRYFARNNGSSSFLPLCAASAVRT